MDIHIHGNPGYSTLLSYSYSFSYSKITLRPPTTTARHQVDLAHGRQQVDCGMCPGH